MSGWIKLHRSLLDWEWYKDLPVRIVFEHLLLKANYEDKKYKGLDIKTGQVITSIRNLAFETGLSVRQVRTALDKLKATQEIAQEKTQGTTQSFSNDNTVVK